MRVLTPDSSSDSVYMELDSEGTPPGNNTDTQVFDMGEAQQPCSATGCVYINYINEQGTPAPFRWIQINRRDGNCLGFCFSPPHGPQRLMSLTAGTHTMKFYGREINSGMDTVILTTDPNFTPTDPNTSGTGPPHWHRCKGVAYQHRHAPGTLYPHTHPCPAHP
jgi:hypothetical protein